MTTHDNIEATPSRSLVEAFSEIARRIHTSEDYDDSLRRITQTATEAIRGCDAASMSLVEKAG